MQNLSCDRMVPAVVVSGYLFCYQSSPPQDSVDVVHRNVDSVASNIGRLLLQMVIHVVGGRACLSLDLALATLLVRRRFRLNPAVIALHGGSTRSRHTSVSESCDSRSMRLGSEGTSFSVWVSRTGDCSTSCDAHTTKHASVSDTDGHMQHRHSPMPSSTTEKLSSVSTQRRPLPHWATSAATTETAPTEGAERRTGQRREAGQEVHRPTWSGKRRRRWRRVDPHGLHNL